MFSSLLHGIPYSVAKYPSAAFARQVEKLLKQEEYDLVIIDHVQMSWITDSIGIPTKKIGLAHNVEHKMYTSFIDDQESVLRRWLYQRESRLMEQLEIGFANWVDHMWVLTKDDAHYFSDVKKHGSVKEIPLCASVATPEEFAAQLCAALLPSNMESSASSAIGWSQNRQSLFSHIVAQGLQTLVQS